VDNLAHSLVGAALGRAIGGDRVRAPAWIGAIAANAPDWSELLIGFRPDRDSGAYYTAHRGITHSFAGAAVETVAIALAVWAMVLLRRSRVAAAPDRVPGDRSLALGRIFLLVGVAVASHLYMDWQGSYGLRPFLPWSGRWYYGDWVAIADPVYWLVPLIALAWGAERHWRDLTPFVLLSGLVIWLVLRTPEVATWLRVSCVGLVGLGAVGWIQYWFGWVGRRTVAALSLVVLALYTGAQAIASIRAKAVVHRTAVARFGPDAQWAALTTVGFPFTWQPIVASSDSVADATRAWPRHLDHPDVLAALRISRRAQALAGFARFLAAEVDSGSRPIVVTLRDVRYARPPSSGWAVVTVPLSAVDAPADSGARR
jgi:inner membrane protein